MKKLLSIVMTYFLRIFLSTSLFYRFLPVTKDRIRINFSFLGVNVRAETYVGDHINPYTSTSTITDYHSDTKFYRVKITCSFSVPKNKEFFFMERYSYYFKDDHPITVFLNLSNKASGKREKKSILRKVYSWWNALAFTKVRFSSPQKYLSTTDLTELDSILRHLLPWLSDEKEANKYDILYYLVWKIVLHRWSFFNKSYYESLGCTLQPAYSFPMDVENLKVSGFINDLPVRVRDKLEIPGITSSFPFLKSKGMLFAVYRTSSSENGDFTVLEPIPYSTHIVADTITRGFISWKTQSSLKQGFVDYLLDTDRYDRGVFQGIE